MKFLKSELSCLVFIYYLQINHFFSFFSFVILLSVFNVFFFITGVPVDTITSLQKLDRIKLGTSVHI